MFASASASATSPLKLCFLLILFCFAIPSSRCRPQSARPRANREALSAELASGLTGTGTSFSSMYPYGGQYDPYYTQQSILDGPYDDALGTGGLSGYGNSGYGATGYGGAYDSSYGLGGVGGAAGRRRFAFGGKGGYPAARGERYPNYATKSVSALGRY